MKHPLFDILISVSFLLLAIRLTQFLEIQDNGIDNIPVNFYPVYSNLQLRTANDHNLLTQIPQICSISILRKSLRFKDHRSGKLTHLYIFVLLISNSWDTETNPGPESLIDNSHFPCGLCDVSVGWENQGIGCDTCNIWYHIECQGMSSTMYGIYNKSLSKSIAWQCIRCGMPNFSTSLFDTTASLEVSNRFETLLSLSEPDSPVPDSIGPQAASSPIVQQPKEAKPKTKKAVLNHPLRILIMNCQSIKNKKAEIRAVIDSAKPDIILGNESWLTPEIINSEFFPDSFDAIREDGVGVAHGGVFIAFRRDLLFTETPELDTDCEIIWCKLNIIGCRTLYLGSFYRPPNRKPEIEKKHLEAFNSSLTRIMSNKIAHVLVGGDFNCGNIEWTTMQVPEGVPNRRVQGQLLEIAQEHCLAQVVNIHTREDKTLDLLLTNFNPQSIELKGCPRSVKRIMT